MIAARAPVDFEVISGPGLLAGARRDSVRFVRVPERRFLAIEGTESPGGRAFTDAIRALYPVAYELHFMLQRRGVHAPVGHLEGRFWIPFEQLMSDATPPSAGGSISWRLLLQIPEEATTDEVDEAIDEVAWTKHPCLLGRLVVDEWEEGHCAQLLHVGPYAAEGPTIRRLHEAIAEAGLRSRGEHHEIYLNDPGRVGQERAKTILRQPVEVAE